MIKCPTALASAQKCLTDTTWRRNATSAITTSLYTILRKADVAYHRRNGSIAWSTFTSDPVVYAPINATELLNAYDNFAMGTQSLVNDLTEFMAASPQSTTTSSTGSGGIGALTDILAGANTSTSNLTTLLDGFLSDDDDTLQISKRQAGFGDILGSLFGTSFPGMNPTFPLIPYSDLMACELTSALNPTTPTFCTSFLQNFLAIPIYYCQETAAVMGTFQGSGGIDVFSMVGGPDSALTSNMVDDLKRYLGVDESNVARLRSEATPTPLALARLGYTIKVGSAYLWTYIVLVAMLLALCLAVLLWESLVTDKPSIAGSFSIVNWLRLRRLFNTNNDIVTMDETITVDGTSTTREQIMIMRDLKVRRRDFVRQAD
jgi:hypothetical protein